MKFKWDMPDSARDRMFAEMKRRIDEEILNAFSIPFYAWGSADKASRKAETNTGTYGSPPTQSHAEAWIDIIATLVVPEPEPLLLPATIETDAETPDCENCEGTGTLDCACMGYDRRCGLCDGDGFVRCYECNGSGKAGGTP